MNSTQAGSASLSPEVSRITEARAGAVVDGATRSALLGDSLRALAGVLLAAHYAQQIGLAPPPASVWQGITAQVVKALPIPSALLPALVVPGLRVAWFSGAAALATLVAIGVAPRVCAALLVCVGAVDYYLLWPAVTPDDYVAEFWPFWLVLLPVGGTLALEHARHWRSWSSRRVPDRSATECALFFVFVLGNVAFRCEPLPPVASLGIFAAAAFAVMPAPFLRRLAIVPLSASLWSLRHVDGAWLLLAASAATCGLWIGTVGVSTAGAPERSRRAAFGVADAIGATAVLLVAVQTAASSSRMPAVARASSAILAQVGLPWSWTATLDPEPIGRLELTLADRDGREEAPAEDLDTANPRVQRMLRVLRSSRAEGAEARAAILRNVATRRCADRSAPWIREGIVILREGGAARVVGRFQCGMDDGEVRIAPANEAAGAEGPEGVSSAPIAPVAPPLP
jgi:hypothetical protein